MRRHTILFASLVLQGCSGDDSATPARDAATDVTSDTGNANDTGPAADATQSDAGDAGADVATADAADGACSVDWTAAPTVVASIEVPDGGGSVLVHAGGAGTQDYSCEQVTVDGGAGYAWVFVGPEASLADCHTAKIGKHFASDAGPTAPEWETNDGTFVIGKKLAAYMPDGGASAVPWLLLQQTSVGGAGVLAKTDYVQRLNTTGGIAPATVCDATNVGAMQKVAYTADYYFYGTP